MSKISIMLQLNGNWDSYGRYRDFQVDGIVVDEDASSSGTLKLIDIPTSPAIVKYESIIIPESTPSVIEVGQVYQDKQTIASAMKHYSVTNKFQFRVKGSSARSYWLVRVGENCTWHFKANSINDFAMFNVRNFNSLHTCFLIDSTFIQYKPTAIVNLTYMQAWRANEKALEFLRGHPADSYSKLPSYLYILEKTYSGPVVVVDGTFLKSAYMGIMLTASTMDAAGIKPINCFLPHNVCTILPLAYAVVDSENDASWKWFFEQFKHTYGERPNMCVVSDRNESILKATSIVYPAMPHYSCMWHIWTNIRAKFNKGHLKLSELYFAKAQSYMLDEFNERMSKIEEIEPRVRAYLYDIGYHRWSRVHATVNKIWTMISNIAESLNAVTKDARELPIVKLLEYMRTLLERWTNEKLLKEKGTFTYLGFKFNKELDDNRTLSHKLRVRASIDYIHTVLDGMRDYIVCLENKRCSCGQFQLDELPCPHALAALRHRDGSYEQYCSPYYTRENLLRTYEIPVNPLPDESKWNMPQRITEEVVNPPSGGKRQPGRPQNKDTKYIMK
uniref:Uncharacterized protein LOC104236649 n=1 Tax=Nicotiana sylvestris TaxID=4096 RepID=A0A1U7XPR9_NICSY|nr:PREDICTED: uncharacterized protein LOC104236649 [Nicotiana sylvestris]